ncbi:MAG: hypothetical protein GYA41_09970 [Bacteroidales bacterium]|nr:hypothetical protein [Bacteroidales bacterium]
MKETRHIETAMMQKKRAGEKFNIPAIHNLPSGRHLTSKINKSKDETNMIDQAQPRVNISFNHVCFHPTIKNKLYTDE